jgi:glutamate-1-semialdehyde 2,1-aminomutase
MDSAAQAASLGLGVYEQTKSQELFERAKRVVPGAMLAGSVVCPDGMYGHYSPNAMAPGYPIYFSRAQGARFWDLDGNEYVDYMCAYGPMILGYKNPVIEEAIRKQNEKSNTVTLAAPLMVDLAEYLVDLVPIADWAFFSKNGGDPTNQSVMVARAATGRKKIVTVAGGYHGVNAWMQDPGSPGTTEEDTQSILRVEWNDVEGLEKVVAENSGEIAAFMSSPWHHPVFMDNELPAPGYWESVEKICRREGIVLIVDDVRAGFRAHMGGSCEYFGFKPDLICFGKALGSGEPIAALVGTDAMRDAVRSVFYTGTQYFNSSPMAASLATLQELQRVDGPKMMIETGKKVADGMVEVAKGHGFDLKVSGMPSMPYLRLTDEDCPVWTQGLDVMHTGLHATWISECTRRGAFFSSFHNHFISTAHSQEDLQRTWDIVDDAFKAVKAAR